MDRLGAIFLFGLVLPLIGIKLGLHVLTGMPPVAVNVLLQPLIVVSYAASALLARAIMLLGRARSSQPVAAY